MHEKNIALLCDEADRLLQLNIMNRPGNPGD